MNRLPNRRHALQCLAASPLMGLGACAGPGRTPVAPLDASHRALLAPTGRLRASINLGNPILAARHAGSGQVSGVSVDLAQALAAQLGVPVELRVVEAALRSVQAVKAEEADIGFFAIDPLRSEGIRFSAAYVLIEGAYLVRQNSPLTDNAQVDTRARASWWAEAAPMTCTWRGN